ncbi:hypothetical protein Goklo_024990, partial [Gossypium klotzschianum]|nr:hypothetical protein [Gossypium klotzschianum]
CGVQVLELALLEKVITEKEDQIFDVRCFGDKGDGRTDDTKAFQDAWSDACKMEGSTVLDPSKFTFLVGPVSLSGANCQPNIVFQLDGIIIAPTYFQCWGNGSLPWLDFTYLRGGVTVQGKGILDGRGSRWWKDDGKEPKIPLNTSFQQISPIHALRLNASTNVAAKAITIQNSPQFHLKFNYCKRVVVHDMTADSLGTVLTQMGSTYTTVKMC